MAAMSPEAAALLVLQREMVETRSQVTLLTNSYDALKGAHDALNLAAQQALADKDRLISEAESRLRNMMFKQQFDLLDSKELKPDGFKGRASETFKPWAKKFKAFCNSKRSGFRAALEWAEKQATPVLQASDVPCFSFCRSSTRTAGSLGASWFNSTHHPEVRMNLIP
jgi:hypothetical protein